ncbi:50S ribosomal protein L11 methyltransferase [Alicyclobacillus tolerans]|uniref:50S ribosomal protein L11 methyltransferase n=1 Tax=Alicyclobacillus tolerans TaxID=90970 RepID=UPI001F0211C9|nr:50S ribosomal protein L11 methyltransferase [Alicyclobacillus tolerans]MCF8563328.1 50S ribosomal protein L11 methyltransferase [Alicyclobacillus tolerans]
MRWWKVSLRVPQAATEAVSALLEEWPEVKGVEITGVHPGNVPHPEYGEWFDESLLQARRALVTVYVPDYVTEADIRHRTAHLRERMNRAGLREEMETLGLSLTRMDESEWASAWQEDFHPIPIGKRLVIVPKWEQEEVGDRLPILLEPGMAFGTGTHATTQLCLLALERIQPQGKRVLDIGCGTAVLSIAAAKLGASSVAAIDIDPVAVDVAAANVRDNHVEGVVRVVQGDLLRNVDSALDGIAYDIAVANILRDPVVALAPQAYAHLLPGGVFIASGFVETQEQMVEAALTEAGFRDIERSVQADWVALTARKPV